MLTDPKPPPGKKINWVQTVPGKGWNTILRLYGPLEPWFDKELAAWRASKMPVKQLFGETQWRRTLEGRTECCTGLGICSLAIAYVRLWHKTDMPAPPPNVRYRG